MLPVILCIIALCIIACLVIMKKQARPASKPAGFVVIPCVPGTEELELKVKSAYWSEMLERDETRRRILIVTFGASAEAYTAKRLAAELKNVEAVDITALADRIRREV